MADLHEYQCPSCGGALAFDIGLQTLKCPFCENVFDVKDFAIADDPADNEQSVPKRAHADEWTQEEQNGLSTYVCQSCAGEIIADTTTGATSCPYCNNPVVIKGHFSGSLRPDSIIPFKFTKEQAIAALKKHYKKRPLLPKTFSDTNKLNEIKGIYVPFWLYSGKADADIEYNGKKVRKWSDSSYNYTEESVFRASRAGTVQYSNIPVDASSKMQNDMMDSIEPFNLSEAVSFNTAYMAGYLADKFDEDESVCFDRANTRVKNSAKDVFAKTVVGYTSVSAVQTSVQFSDVATSYTLLPVWLLNTTWDNTQYTFAMNGQTGRLVGELPIDKKKSRLLFFGITAALFAATIIVYIIGGLL